MIPTYKANSSQKVTPMMLSGRSSDPDPRLATYAWDFTPPPVTRPDWLTTTGPTPTVTAFKPLCPTDAQGAPHSMMPYIDVPIQDLWDSDLAPLHPLAPIDMAADWNATSGLVFPSVDLLTTQTSNEGKGAFNPPSIHQYYTASQPIPYASFYTSTSLTVPLRDPEANINGDPGATSDMTTAKASQIDTQYIHTVEGDGVDNKEKEERSGFIFADTMARDQHSQENRSSAHSGLIHGTSLDSIPKLAYQSQHPTTAEVRSPPADHFSMSQVQMHRDATVGPIRQQLSSRKRRQALQRVYDKPGKKPAVTHEASLRRLLELSRQRGGQDFAITWIAKIFSNGVTPDALTRTLLEGEVNAVEYDHGFRLSQAYDGLLEKVEDRFGCGLCPEENRANWKNKKDSVRHLKKFHFGIGKTCGMCNMTYYSRAELNKHVCCGAVGVP